MGAKSLYSIDNTADSIAARIKEKQLKSLQDLDKNGNLHNVESEQDKKEVKEKKERPEVSPEKSEQETTKRDDREISETKKKASELERSLNKQGSEEKIPADIYNLEWPEVRKWLLKNKPDRTTGIINFLSTNGDPVLYPGDNLWRFAGTDREGNPDIFSTDKDEQITVSWEDITPQYESDEACLQALDKVINSYKEAKESGDDELRKARAGQVMQVRHYVQVFQQKNQHST